ncbi:hypothetical protein OROMI_028850 [Orobanche minor]
MLSKPKKNFFGGYESMAGDVNTVLRTLKLAKSDLVRRSTMGEYTRLDAATTRSGNMIYYVVCHQVTPKPNFDPTSLFFKIGDKVLQFSRVEYALVSGLRFGPSNFDPYAKHELPKNSMFERVFGADETTKLYDVRLAYISKKFVVNDKEVNATHNDYVKLSKFLFALVGI